jgi:hypothetical protein
MDIEDLIKDTFAAHEQDAPDGAPVLAAARRRIKRSRAVRGGPIAVAAAVVVLAVAAVTVVALNRPADQSPVDAAGGGQAPAPAAKAPAKATITGVAMPFSLGWLPSGEVDYIARRINIGGTGEQPDKPLYDGEYLLTIKQGKPVVLLVDVQEMPVPAGEATFKSGPGRPVTINGRSGVESSNSGGPGGYELYLTRSGGGSMYVNVSPEPGSKVPAQRLIDTGRRVAQHIEFPGSTTVMPAFGLRNLPSDKRVCAFDIGDHADPPAHGPSTSYDLGTCTTMPSIQVTNNSASEVSGVPGHPVQGHETRYADDGTLWVLDAVHGDPIAIAGMVSQAELYDVANHLVLPS